ncbi:SDR family NAD(P)-dependent oxidoreductase [Marinoscillum sp.]|uniref:SDR family NAD(P)-dependent oxidoreductase n=1 Tax=Marinoscillum sp. TaxID=2024838 RepID=UPI003BA868EF
MEKISILGCGWLGLPLAKALIQAGHPVKGSTTHSEKISLLRAENINPYLINLDPTYQGPKDFFESDLVIINLPPRNRNEDPSFHQKQLLSIRENLLISGVPKAIFVSSTAVYPNLNRVVTEQDASAKSLSRAGISLLDMEHLFTEVPNLQSTIIRFGGLYGPGRHPGRFLTGGKQLDGGKNPVNMIHLDDCIGVIQTIIRDQHWNQTFNACSPKRQTRAKFYTRAAKDLGVEIPDFTQASKPYKEVSSEKMLSQTGYRFFH